MLQALICPSTTNGVGGHLMRETHPQSFHASECFTTELPYQPRNTPFLMSKTQIFDQSATNKTEKSINQQKSYLANTYYNKNTNEKK